MTVWGRSVTNSPLQLTATPHNPPLRSYGGRGGAEAGLATPCALTADNRGALYVADTGNCRLAVLDWGTLKLTRHLTHPCLEGRSVTGVCLGAAGDTVLVTNWRTRQGNSLVTGLRDTTITVQCDPVDRLPRTVTELSVESGQEVNCISHPDLQEPVAVAVNKQGQVYVADPAAGAVLVFSPAGKLVSRVVGAGSGGRGRVGGAEPGQFRELSR